MSRWTRPERRRKAASSRSRQISVFGGSWCWACLVRFLRDLSLLPLQTGPARPPAPPAGSGSQARSPRLGQASVALWSVYFGGAFSWFSPPWLAGGPPGPRWRNAGGDFYFQNHAQVSISEVLFPGSRPRGLPAPPPAPPDHHCAGFLRSGAPEPACRTQTGRLGSRICRDFAVRRGKNGSLSRARYPGRPNRVRHADSLAPDRRDAADLKPGSPGLRAARRFYRGT